MPSAFAVPTRTVNKYGEPPTERLLATMKVHPFLATRGVASLIYTGMSPSLYSAYRFDWYGIVPSDANNVFQFSGSTDGGITYSALWQGAIVGYNGSASSSSFTATASVALNDANMNDGEPTTGSLTFAYGMPRGNGPTDVPIARWQLGSSWNGGNWTVKIGSAFYNSSTTEINTLRFTMNTNNIRRGALCVYGLVGYSLGANAGITV